MRRVSARLIPFLGLCFFVASLDRTNISVAALTMNDALGLSAQKFGLGVGAFYVTYVLFSVPSNLVLSRLGARIWLAVLLITWGIVSAMTAAVRDGGGLIIARLALGAAEAGLFPGVIFFALRWFPSAYRARFTALFVACGVAAAAIGPLISVPLLRLENVLGLQGWQWLFVIEGLPAVLLGLSCLGFLTDNPAEASWLSPQESAWLTERIDEERRVINERKDQPARGASILWMLVLSASVEVGTSCLGYWLPTVLKSMDFTDAAVGSLASCFGLCGMVAMYLWSRRSDRRQERLWHLAIPLLMSGLGLAAAGGGLSHAALALPAMCMAVIGVTSAAPILWAMPERYLPPRRVAAGIALINSVGNIAGIVSPAAVGTMRDLTGDFHLALIASGAPMILGALCIPFMALSQSRRLVPRPR
ncbi:MFS transporter [Nitrospirillum viridazoti]|uniref:ACS family tartrate transporter-like MFS transporter n=1 Tax=Nitrospirillum amazonense TaxID=28077 RepID=A0A560HQT1_9PROT|nr:MFS transporter [Nitrospirillum amazonense]TWB48933.1 ACS family tartrate transporter-like MFS transporter [Nitrospirillum amazonense]